MDAKWTRNIRRQKNLGPGDRLRVLDAYLRGDRGARARLRARYELDSQSLVQWAMAYYGQGLRELRRLIGRPSQ